jgi:hypothetical protein
LASNAKNSKDFSAKNQVAKGHCYPLFLVLFCVQYLGYGTQSFSPFYRNPCKTNISQRNVSF